MCKVRTFSPVINSSSAFSSMSPNTKGSSVRSHNLNVRSAPHDTAQIPEGATLKPLLSPT